ncbi:copper resistance protein NlpE N-terminal domain-containing protein [Pantoea sp. FN060301]|uniref:copper resistance protein NlpE N-terminal domain-containing protein n=1 Tax=Pantoea sp. FN060301 TaxID=3420380 RepID=UPI003D1679BC
MKKSVMVLLATMLAGMLTGCQGREAAIAAQPAPQAIAQTFRGIIPCADCEGIEVTLLLQQGGQYRLNERYLGADNVAEPQHGRWTRTAEKLVLVSDKGEKRYFRPYEQGLEMMDTQGHPIHSTNSYRLQLVN